MLKKLAAIMFVIAVVLSFSALGFAQSAGKEARVEGKVVRTNKDKSTITVHVRDVNVDKTVIYDASTKWTSQYHGEKNVNTIDASEVKDGDHVICLGWYDDKGEFHAATISKRLSHSPE